MSCRRLLSLSLAMSGSVFASTALVAAEANQPTEARLVIQNDTVYDRKTDLTWQRCTYGQNWQDAQGCVGTPQKLGFDEAKQLQANGWRMPTLDELNTIVVHGVSPSIDGIAFPNTPPTYFWATDNRDLNSSWYVFFENGRVNHYFPPRTNKDLLRLVRTGKLPTRSGKP